MAGNVVSNVKKYYGGQVPVPGQGDSDGKVKVLVEKTATIEIGGVQTEVELLYDADDLTTPVTPQQLGQWTDENYLIAFKKREDDGRVRGFILYALETDSTSTDTLVNRAEFISFKEDMTDPGASAYEFTMVEDSSTLTRYLRDENGELIVKFNQATVEAGAQSGTLDNLIGSDSEYMHFEVVHDENNNAYLNLNTESLDGELDDIYDYLGNIWDIVNARPSDEHGYFNSSLIQTPGDGTTTNIIIDDFRISQGGDVHGESIEFVPTHQEGGIDFGEVYLNPGTYIFTVHYTLQWVGNPRGTFLPLVTNVGDRPFDFSYEHEDVVRTTRIVTRTTRGKFSLGFPIDADTPQMGIWVKNLEIAQIASYNHAAVAHDTTLIGTGKLDSPLGVTPAAFGKVKDIPTSISQFRTGDVIPVDGPNGTAKMGKNDLLKETAQNALAGNVAQEFDPTRTENNAYKIGEFVTNGGEIYQFVETHYGAWNSAKAIRVPVGDAISLCSNVFGSKRIHLAGHGANTLRTPLIPVVNGQKVSITVPSNWNASSNIGSNRSKFALRYYDTTEHTYYHINVLNNDVVNNSYTYIVGPNVNFIGFYARGNIGENVEFYFDLNEIEYVDSKVTAFPYTIAHTFSRGGNDSRIAYNLYRCGSNKFVRFKFSSDWADESVTYSKMYIMEIYPDGTEHDTMSFTAHTGIPLNLKYKTSKNCVSLVFAIRGDANETVSCHISVEDIQLKHKISPTAIWRGNVRFTADDKPNFLNNYIDSRFTLLGYRCIPLKAGDTIWCEEGYRFYTASSADGYVPYVLQGWIISSGYYVAKSDCFLYLLFSSENETAIEDIDAAVQNFTILTDIDTGISPVSELVNSMRLHRASVLGVNHRGFNTIAPENTIVAFEMSRDYGFEYVETDLQYSSDNVPVLIHDDTVDRTSNGSGSVSSMTLEQLKALDFGSWKDASYAGTKIPTFDEFLDFVCTTGMSVFLEIKAGTLEMFLSLVLPSIVKRGILDKFHFIHFSADFIAGLNANLKHAKLGIICYNDITSVISYLDGLPKDNENLLFIDTSNSDVLSSQVGKDCKYPIATWTVDTPSVLLKQTPYYAVTSNFHDVSQELFVQSIAKVKSDIYS